MVSVALAFAVLEVGGSASEVGLVLACGTATLVVSLLAGGVVADRASRRAVMVASDLVRMMSQGIAAALLIAGAAEVWMLAALAAVTGAATGFFRPASTGLLPAVVPPEGLQRANGMRATAMSIGEIGGPLVAGVIVAAASAGWAIAGDAATFALSALLLAGLRVPRRAEREPRSFLGDLRDGWDAFRLRTWVWTVVATTCAANVVWGAWSALGPVVAHRDLGGAAAWGTVLAVMGAGTLVGGLVAAAGRLRRPLVVYAVSGAFCAVPLAALAAGVPVPLLALAAGVGGAALMLGNASWYATLQRHVPDESLSRVSAYDELGSAALYPVGLAIWGPVAASIGITPALWIAFAVLVVTALSPLVVPEVRHMRA
jgi:predicted MFS family arabinose efflux permease